MALHELSRFGKWAVKAPAKDGKQTKIRGRGETSLKDGVAKDRFDPVAGDDVRQQSRVTAVADHKRRRLRHGQQSIRICSQ